MNRCFDVHLCGVTLSLKDRKFTVVKYSLETTVLPQPLQTLTAPCLYSHKMTVPFTLRQTVGTVCSLFHAIANGWGKINFVDDGLNICHLQFLEPTSQCIPCLFAVFV